LLGFVFLKVRPSSKYTARWSPVLLGAFFALLGFVFVRPLFHSEIQLLEGQNPVYSPMTDMAVFVAWVWVGLLVVWGIDWGHNLLSKRKSSHKPLPFSASEPVESVVPMGKSYAGLALLMAAVVVLFTAGSTLFRSSIRKARR